MTKETTEIITERQEKLLATVIIRNITDKLQDYLNDKEITRTFLTVTDLAEKIVIEFKEMDLKDEAFKEIRIDLEKEESSRKGAN